MRVTWLLTVMGEDRPELLQQVARSVGLMEGIFLDSQQSVMNGKLVALWKVLLPAAHVGFARQAFTRLSEQGLRLSIEELESEVVENNARDGLILDISGSFRFGIDHEIRLILESHGACVEQLNQQYVGAPQLGEQPFSSRIRARLTRPLSASNLRRALKRLAPDLKVEIRTEQLVSV